MYDNGSSCTTMGGGETFYDEAGERHRHNPNRVTSSFRCSNGHWISTQHGYQCPNVKCDWVTPWPTRMWVGTEEVNA
jgi:hypothetical protein